MKALLILTYLILTSTLLETYQTEPSNTKLLIGYFRHGARREQKAIKSDNVAEYPDPNFGIGDLTPTGMRQEYLLGKALSVQYPQLFGKTADISTVKVHGSTFNRTIASAHSLFSGIYDLGSGQDIESDVKRNYLPPIEGFNPEVFEGKSALPNSATLFPVIVSSFVNNHLFTPDNDVTCKPLNARRKEIEKQMNLDYTKDFEPLFAKLNEFGYKPSMFEKDSFDFLSGLEVCDLIVSRAFNDHEFDKFDASLMEQCVYLNTFHGFRLNSGDYVKAINQKINQKVIQILEDFLNPKIEKKEKAVLFSGHDTSLESFWNNFFPDNWKCVLGNYKAKYGRQEEGDLGEGQCVDLIKFSANMLFEVHEEEGEFLMNLRFNNRLVFMNGGNKKVSVKEVIQLLKDSANGDWDKICRPEVTDKKIGAGLMYLFIATTILVLLTVGYYVSLSRTEKKSTADYEYNAI